MFSVLCAAHGDYELTRASAEQAAYYMQTARDLSGEHWDDSYQALLHTHLGKP